MTQFHIECVTEWNISCAKAHTDSQHLQVSLLDVKYSLPGVKPFAQKGVEVLVKAQALEDRPQICHSCAERKACMLLR